MLPAIPNQPSAFATFPGENGKIAFVRENAVFIMNADGSGQTHLAHSAAGDHAVGWSPDGTKIAFASFRDGNEEIYVINSDGTGERRLTNNNVMDRNPSWSPDGTKIAFGSKRDGNNEEIYVMNADGRNPTRLTNNPELNNTNKGPSWSPDGTKIAFHSTRDGNFEIYVMNADGSGETNVSNNPSRGSSWPDWGTALSTTPQEDTSPPILTVPEDITAQATTANAALW